MAQGGSRKPANVELLSDDVSASSFSGYLWPVAVTAIIGALLYLIIGKIFRGGNQTASGPGENEKETADGVDSSRASTATTTNVSGKGAGAKRKDGKPSRDASQDDVSSSKYTHPLLVATLKGHAAAVCDGDFSATAKYFVTSAEGHTTVCGIGLSRDAASWVRPTEYFRPQRVRPTEIAIQQSVYRETMIDRSVNIWTCADFLTDQPSKSPKNNRLNLEFDHASSICFSPDSKALLAHMHNENLVRILKLTKKPDGNWAPPQKLYDLPKGKLGDITRIGIQCNGKFIMTAYDNGQFSVWSIRGDPFESVDSTVGTLLDAKISPCGRFVAASGTRPVVTVWAVVFGAGTDKFESVEKAFEITGHILPVPSFAFSGDSSHLATVSFDKTFRLFDMTVDHKKKQSPSLVKSSAWTTEHKHEIRSLNVVLTNDSRCAVISADRDILIFSTSAGNLCHRIESALAAGPSGAGDRSAPSIHRLFLDPSSGFILAMGDRLIRVFRNVPSLEITTKALKESAKFASQDSVRVRLQQQFDDASKKLALVREQYPKYQ